ncbi:DNA polymerase III subunit beta [Sporichthya sp.]|uniref:DNA polymerase III subunit beta n=1 Tax=Sporichthya sp. TaxID=65475 RepID=UPI0017BBC61C|nr:DNA polymerase III subunit beta [Sporichthya sp.]MBA3741692.1 DNA polymerase III subunit beta [Sporichthya sp.]
MKFRVERDVLAEAVAWTARSLPVRPPVAVLAGLLLTADENGLALSGFDYEVSARAEVSADIAAEGRALVSGRLLADICKSLPAKPVDISIDGTKVNLVCGSARFSLLTLPVEDYPTLPEMPSRSGAVPADVFAHAVAQVAVAAGRDDTLPILTGIRIEIDGDTVTLAATDRYRLAVREFTWKPEQQGMSAFALVPAKTLADTAKSMTGEVELALSSGASGEGLVGLTSSGRRTTSRLLEGDFPKYRSLLPSESLSYATVATAPFHEAVRRVSLVAERNTPVRLSFSAGELVLEAGSGDEASASEALEAQLDGDDIAIAFNPTYLLDGLGALDSSHVRLAFTTSTKPAIITPTTAEGGGDGTEYRHLLMPVRLSG